MRPLIIPLLVFFLFMSCWSALCALDQFGQDVPPDFNKKIDEIKEYRLPYQNNTKYNPRKAIDLANELLKTKPDYYRAYYNLGLAYSELNDYENASKNFDKAFEIREKYKIPDVTIFNSAGWVSMKFGDYKKAEDLFKRGIALEDKNKESSNRSLYNNLGLLYFNTQRFDEAKKYLTVARDKYKSDSAANTLKIIEEIEKGQGTKQ